MEYLSPCRVMSCFNSGPARKLHIYKPLVTRWNSEVHECPRLRVLRRDTDFHFLAFWCIGCNGNTKIVSRDCHLMMTFPGWHDRSCQCYRLMHHLRMTKRQQRNHNENSHDPSNYSARHSAAAQPEPTPWPLRVLMNFFDCDIRKQWKWGCSRVGWSGSTAETIVTRSLSFESLEVPLRDLSSFKPNTVCKQVCVWRCRLGKSECRLINSLSVHLLRLTLVKAMRPK